MILLGIALAFVVIVGAVYLDGGFRHVWHRVVGHPDEARWEGDYTGGCTVGSRACGAVWETEDPR